MSYIRKGNSLESRWPLHPLWHASRWFAPARNPLTNECRVFPLLVMSRTAGYPRRHALPRPSRWASHFHCGRFDPRPNWIALKRCFISYWMRQVFPLQSKTTLRFSETSSVGLRN
jgi:hypothetical protein